MAHAASSTVRAAPGLVTGLALAALAALAASCGPDALGPDLVVNGAPVSIRTGAPFARAADFPGRIETTLEAALHYWGGSWDDLAGIRITLSDEATVPCGGGQSLGCFDGRELRLTTRDPALGTFACVEATVLVHEVGHAVLGDASHTDPRWMELGALAEELSGRVGYGDQGVTECPIYPSVWRHPLGVP